MHSASQGVGVAPQSERVERSIWFSFFMHFSTYLMIAALTCIGLKAVYMLCQLVAFVL